MNTNTVIELSSIRTGCQNCSLSPLCLPNNNSGQEKENTEKPVTDNKKFERGEYVFHINDPFKTVYAIRTGSVKTYTSLEDGNEQVNGLHLPGALLGLASISTNYHTESAIALESCSICEISFEKLEHLSNNNPAMQHALLNIMSKEIQYAHRQITLLSRLPAEARLASFLISVSKHFQQRGFSATDFHLRMTRGEIANLLGLAVETVSRLFSLFQKKGLLTVERRHIVLFDIDGLMQLTPNYYRHSLHGYVERNKAS